MSDGTGMDLQALGLGLIAQGITGALDELREIGSTGDAATGRGFSDLELTGLELGHGELTSALASFCERWDFGVRNLVHEGSAFAKAVGLSAGTFYEYDQYVGGTLKVAVNSVIGNPHLSEGEVSRMSWSDIASHHALAGTDWSDKSFEESWDNSKEIWRSTADDVKSSSLDPGDSLDPRTWQGKTPTDG
ncbi:MULTISPECIES: hypothetical protein [unclassified Streptomyces]|uniref:hypothetical protein n=1 Tax=unclassified Streptomyces TaxID=2593676 RepID=UPI003D7407EB